MHGCINFAIGKCTVLLPKYFQYVLVLYLSTVVISIGVLVLHKLKSTCTLLIYLSTFKCTWPHVCYSTSCPARYTTVHLYLTELIWLQLCIKPDRSHNLPFHSLIWLVQLCNYFASQMLKLCLFCAVQVVDLSCSLLQSPSNNFRTLLDRQSTLPYG